jgi:mRNA interferase YafQ
MDYPPLLKLDEGYIDGDFLLIYKLEKSNADERIIFIRAGTHVEFFE